MTAERFDLHDQRSPSLPPLEAWKDPEAWLDLKTGLPKQGRTLLEVPTDSRDFIKIDELTALVKTTLFKDEFEWKHDPANRETRSDDHHFYFTAEEYGLVANNGNAIPRTFRELSPNIGRMPRQFHNAIHAFTEKPAMPSMDNMYDYIRSYQLAHAAFKRLYLTANETVTVMGSFAQRRRSVAQGLVKPKDELDSIGEEILKSTFRRHFSRYSDAVEQFKETEGKEIVYKEHEALKVTRPTLVARKMGAIVNRKAVIIRLDSIGMAA